MNNHLENHCQMGVLSVNTIKNRMILFILIQTPTLLGQQIAAFNQVSTCIDQNIPLSIHLLLHLLQSTKNQIISLKKVANDQNYVNNVYSKNLDSTFLSLSRQNPSWYLCSGMLRFPFFISRDKVLIFFEFLFRE